MNIKIAHTADNHLRDTQYSRKHRGADFSYSFEYMVDLCIQKEVDAIANSGDILDTTRPSPDSMTVLKRTHAKLKKAGIPMYVISGNHDKTKPHWVKILAEESTEPGDGGFVCIDGETANVKGITLRGMPYMNRNSFLEQEKEGSPATILMCHLAINEFIDFPSKKAVDLAELPVGRYKLIAAGDIHVHESKKLSDGTVVAYPGSTEACRANENPNKFVDIYEFDENQNIVDTKAHPLPSRRLIYERIMTEEEFVELLAELEKSKEEFPIVYLKYKKEIENVSMRVRAILDSDRCIIRTIPFSDKFSLPNRGSTGEDMLAPIEFVERFIIRGTKLFELGEELAQEHNDPHKAINSYIEAKLGRNELTE